MTILPMLMRLREDIETRMEAGIPPSGDTLAVWAAWLNRMIPVLQVQSARGDDGANRNQ